jgi:hypothetical protein
MTANLFGDRYYGRAPFWHALGTVNTDRVNAVEAMKRCGLDYRVEKCPVFVGVDSGDMVQAEGKLALTRYPTSDDPLHRVFGFVTDQYQVLDNLRAAQQLDKLTDGWPVETVGALGKGETVFLSLDMGEWEVSEEAMKAYLLFVNWHTGTRAAQFVVTDVRVGCQNTLVTGLKQAVISAAIQHDSNAEADLAWRTTLLAKVEESHQQMRSLFGDLAAKHIKLADAKKVFEMAYPVKAAPGRMRTVDSLSKEERAELEAEGIDLKDSVDWLRIMTARMEARRVGALDRYQADQWADDTAETAWAAYNAVVEVEDYRGKPTASALASMMFGDRARTKAKAFDAAYAFVGRK